MISKEIKDTYKGKVYNDRLFLDERYKEEVKLWENGFETKGVYLVFPTKLVIRNLLKACSLLLISLLINYIILSSWDSSI